MINTWWFNLIAYLIVYVIFTQFFKIATKSSKNDGALTILIQILSGVIILILVPLFELKFSTNLKTYILLIIACVFYAIADRCNTTARRGLDVSIQSIIAQLSTVFIIVFGILFLKEEIIVKKIFGALLIIAGNVLVLYRKGKFEFNKYILFGLMGTFAQACGISVDVGISEQFNLPIYVATTLMVPSLIILIFERIKVKDVIAEFKDGDKKAILTVCASWGIMIILMLRAYQFGSVTTVAPLCALTTILNVLVAYIVLKERDSVAKKIISALIVLLGIVLIQM